jgi:hypothetical protein
MLVAAASLDAMALAATAFDAIALDEACCLRRAVSMTMKALFGPIDW